MKIIIILTLVLCLIFFKSFYSKAYSDLLYLKGSNSGIEVEIKEADKDSVTAAIPRKHISDIEVNRLDTVPYPDILELQYNNDPIHCKVIEIGENVVHTRIPMDEIVSFNVGFTNSTDSEDVYYKRENNRINTPGITTLYKNRQKDEKDGIISKDIGMIKGSILFQGNPLAKCQVKIYRLTTKGFLFFKSYKQEEYYETITDSNGCYLFGGIPAGAYKLYWKNSLGEPWMKRIETEPDIIVVGGKQAIVSPLDINSGLIE